MIAWRLRAHNTARMRTWIETIVTEGKWGVVPQDDPTELGQHGSAVVARAHAVYRAAGAYWYRPLRRVQSPCSYVLDEGQSPDLVLHWARQVSGLALEWQGEGTDVLEERWRLRAVAAGRHARKLRGASRAEFAQRTTDMERWVRRSGQGTGQVTRRAGSWDGPPAAEEQARADRRLKRRDTFRAAKGESADRNGTWGFERVMDVRLARYGGSGIEAQLEWRGDWGELQTQWVPVDATHVPSLRLRRAMIARYVDRWGPLPTPARRVVAAVGERPAHSRHQPARGAAPSFPRFQKKQSKWEIWMASALPRCVVGDAEWRLIVKVEARLTRLRKRTE